MTSSVYVRVFVNPLIRNKPIRVIIGYLRSNTRIRVSQMLVKEIKMLLEVSSVGKHL